MYCFLYADYVYALEKFCCMWLYALGGRVRLSRHCIDLQYTRKFTVRKTKLILQKWAESCSGAELPVGGADALAVFFRAVLLGAAGSCP